ncbi:MAG: hypothetical protein P8N43_08855 [Alphaproteobacteria bacterium]|nr:hypothetical protein [Alphaproteobacteria bacterium]
MTKDIGSAFRSLGADVREMGYRPGQNAPEILPDLTSWLAESRDGGTLVDVNGAIVTSNPGARAIENHAECFDSFSFLTDTPLNFPSRLENWPLGRMVRLVDASFFDLARFMKYQRPSFLFHPHGGPPTPPYVPDTKDRDIEFLFIGNIAKVDDATSHAASLYKNDPVLIELFLSSFENVTPDKTPFQITLSTALTRPATYRRKDVALVAVHLELYLSIPRLSADPKKAGIFAEEGFLSGHGSRWIFERGGALGPEDCDPPSERDPRGGAAGHRDLAPG